MMSRQPSKLVLIPFGVAALLSACGPEAAVNPPTDPAPAIETPGMASPGVGSGAAGAGLMPGTGPATFVGRWAANVEWCTVPTGEGRPIEITATRFKGYENSCEIADVEQIANGYEAVLQCQSEGTTSTERVRMVVTGQSMALTYLDRGTNRTTLTKCTTLGDTSTQGPALPMP